MSSTTLARVPAWAFQLATFGLLFVGSAIYGLGLVEVARTGWVAELAVGVGTLLLALPFFQQDAGLGSRVRLLAIESIFLLIVVALKANSTHGLGLGEQAFRMAFAVFFVVQVGGFLVSQVMRKRVECVPASLLMGVGLWFWFSGGQGVGLGPEAEVVFWGGNAPLALQAMYGAWLLVILLVDFRNFLPKGTILAVHLASYLLALGSEEFFHVRILTAYNLFVLNSLFLFGARRWGGLDFASLPVLAVLNEDGPGVDPAASARWRNGLAAGLTLACAAFLGMLVRGF